MFQLNGGFETFEFEHCIQEAGDIGIPAPKEDGNEIINMPILEKLLGLS